MRSKCTCVLLLIRKSTKAFYLEFAKTSATCFFGSAIPMPPKKYYNKAYTLDPDSDVLLVNFGSLALFAVGNSTRHSRVFREAVTINDQNDKGWVGLVTDSSRVRR